MNLDTFKINPNPKVKYSDLSIRRYPPTHRGGTIKVLTSRQYGPTLTSGFVVWQEETRQVYPPIVFPTLRDCNEYILTQEPGLLQPALVMNELDRAMDPTGVKTWWELA